jgi:hypothetical protein
VTDFGVETIHLDLPPLVGLAADGLWPGPVEQVDTCLVAADAHSEE